MPKKAEKKYTISYDLLDSDEQDIESGLNCRFIITFKDQVWHYYYHTKLIFNNSHFIDLCMIETIRLIKADSGDGMHRQYTLEGKWEDY